MNDKLLHYMKQKPACYADSTSKFWDDEHISAEMLKAHLDPNLEAASRKHDFIQDSASWIASLSENVSSKKLLDLGCGPGLYAEAFHQHGFSVTGIDFSRRSIDYAIKQAELKQLPITYHYLNYLDIDYVQEFDVITLIYCDFGVLKPEDRTVLLKKIKQALKPNGMLIMDAFTKNQYNDFTEKKSIKYEDSGFWNTSPYLCIVNRYRYDDQHAFLEQNLIITEQDCQCYNIWNQAFDQISLQEELHQAGFTEFSFFENVAGKPWEEGSKTICILGK